MFKLTKTCRECGAFFETPQPRSAFCSTLCRTAFNRRRHDRGTELYDLMMANRFGRSKPDRELIERVIGAYRSADLTIRHGRPSWQEWDTAQTRIPMGYAQEGDGR